jgi:hypothetical protein
MRRIAVTDTAFVIGPGRSGTTLLYKLMCMHPAVAYISSLEKQLPWLPVEWTGRIRVRSFAGKLRYWFLKGGNAYLVNKRLLQKLVPIPVEGEGLYRLHGLPANAELNNWSPELDGSALRTVFSRLREVSGKTVFVSKRTANNRRLPTLDAIFPTARFVNLKRDGRDVAESLSSVAWWNDHPLWWDPQHRTPLQVSAQGDDMLRLCARNWVAETEAIQGGLARIAPRRVLEVQFERLVDAPVVEMRRVLDFVGLQSSAEYERAVTALGLGFRPGLRRRKWSADQLAMVNREQGPQLKRQGYGI